MKNIMLCPDGKYRWVYDFNLYKKPIILQNVLQIFSVLFGGLWLWGTFICLFDKDFGGKSFLIQTHFFVVLWLSASILCAVGYYLYAVCMGGRYCILFEMDEKGIRHIQVPRQFKKEQLIKVMQELIDMTGKNFGIIGISNLVDARMDLYSKFYEVKSTKAYPWLGLIKLGQTFNKNLIYVERDDFDFIWGYILIYCQNIQKT